MADLKIGHYTRAGGCGLGYVWLADRRRPFAMFRTGGGPYAKQEHSQE